jgi:hypothetical protein
MSDLLELALDAHGDLQRWKQLTEISATVAIGGTTWPRKGQEGFFTETVVTIDPQVERTRYQPLAKAGDSLVFTPDHVAILDDKGGVLEERNDPKLAFAGHAADTKWDNLHVAYFAGYAMWNYLTIPFLLTYDGFEVDEIDPWIEGGEQWRRLKVRFPTGIATHNDTQTFYFGPDYLLRRHDYAADVFGGAPVAHYTEEHKTFEGFSFPTRRRVVPRRSDGSTLDKPVAITIDVLTVSIR